MEQVKEFLDVSTIHGLSWISGTRNWSRYFWIVIVIGGFSGAGYLISTSFDNWKQSPISTTVETLSISKITFPNVTICPPKNLILNLNYDFQNSENVKLDNGTRKKLFDYALNVIQDELIKELMTNLSKVEDPDRFGIRDTQEYNIHIMMIVGINLSTTCSPLLHQETYQHNILLTSLMLRRWRVT